MTQITLPQLDGSTQATVEHYFLQPGDAVASGQPLAIVLTERFEWEIPATAAGTIAAILTQPGTSVAVGAPLVQLDAAADASVAPAAAAPTTVTAPISNGRSAERLPRVTPVARSIATTHGLDLTTIRGSGPGGLIRRADVLTLAHERSMVVVEPGVRLGFAIDEPALRPRTAAPPVAKPVRAAKAQPQLVVHRQPALENRKWAVPHALAAVEIDLTEVLAYVAAHAQRLLRRGITLTPTSCVAAAAVAALGEHRLLNSVWSEDGLLVRGAVHLAVVQHTPADGIRERVVARAAELNVQGLARAISTSSAADPAARASLTLAEAGTTHWSQAVIPDGQAALLSLGATEQRPMVVARAGVDTILIRPVALLTLAYDARIIMPYQADAFLNAVKRRVEQFSAL